MEKDKVQNDKIQSNGKISNKDLERVNVEPAALSDADLDNVAGGVWGTPAAILAATNIGIDAGSARKIYTLK